jgi:hypothetical protein
VADQCKPIATASLLSLLSTICSTVEFFVLGTQPVDFNLLPPFVTFLVYKAAAIVTERLVPTPNENEGLKQLRILRNFLRIVGERWLGCGEFVLVRLREVCELTRHVQSGT